MKKILIALSLLLWIGCNVTTTGNNETPVPTSGFVDSSSSSKITLSSSSEQVGLSSNSENLSSSSINVEVCFPEGHCGSFIDSRDSMSYKWVEIEGVTWMAENLAFDGVDYECYDDSLSNCDVYGNMYSWSVAWNNESASYSVPSAMMGICPTGWHIPSIGEFDALPSYYDLGWPVGENTDLHGFNPLAGGYKDNWDEFKDLGAAAYWMTSSDQTYGSLVSKIAIEYKSQPGEEQNLSSGYIRCVKD